MIRHVGAPLLLAASLVLSACAGNADARQERAREEQAPIVAAREARFDSVLAHPGSGDSTEKPIARWMLGNDLSEISGLALTSDGRLFAHSDERAEVTEINYKTGVIIKHFLVGTTVIRDDFEGITMVGDRFFMMTSNGTLYEFKEGADKSQVPFVLHDAHLGKECELEGVAYDPSINSLVMPCKVVNLPELKGKFVMYRWSLDSLANPRVSQVSVPLKDVIGAQGWEDFHASDITVDLKTGNYVVVAAQEKGLIVVTPKGAPVSARTLDDVHNQVEGVAITKDDVLILSDEIGKKQPAAITMYRLR